MPQYPITPRHSKPSHPSPLADGGPEDDYDYTEEEEDVNQVPGDGGSGWGDPKVGTPRGVGGVSAPQIPITTHFPLQLQMTALSISGE